MSVQNGLRNFLLGMIHSVFVKCPFIQLWILILIELIFVVYLMSVTRERGIRDFKRYLIWGLIFSSCEQILLNFTFMIYCSDYQVNEIFINYCQIQI